MVPSKAGILIKENYTVKDQSNDKQAEPTKVNFMKIEYRVKVKNVFPMAKYTLDSGCKT